MKNAKSSLLSIALILALLTTLLSGCGQNQSTDNQQEADTLMPSSTANPFIRENSIVVLPVHIMFFHYMLYLI